MGYVKSDWKVKGAKWNERNFEPILAKNHGLTPWDLVQNFKFSRTLSRGKKSREMMFWVIFRVIGSKVERKNF